jgi:PPK2 family polyphosphate:nucleotide phosphotransferase
MRLSRRLIVEPGTRVKLADLDTDATPGYAKKPDIDALLRKSSERMAELQYRMYAENERALLVVLQAMDTGGKDGTIRHVMTGLNPVGVHVKSFKVPSDEERDHDYLWRVHQAVPPLGDFGIFNRSHYEDVIVVRVHGLVPKSVWKKRYREINEFERYLVENDVTILKFFLHISNEEQKKRLQGRIDEPTKRWKLAEGDFVERERWDDYMRAYEEALTRCSTEWAPWYVVPADRKWFRNLAVAEIMLDTLEAMDMKFPKPSVDLSKLQLR